MDIKREAYDKLLKWKAANSGHVLEIRSARQVGKTYILDKFAKENYHKYISSTCRIPLADSSLSAGIR